MSILSEDQLARLHTHLIVPVTVGDILYNNLDVEDDMQFGLHEALSELDPDAALLAIAVSAKHIALRYIDAMPIAAALSLEASKVIDEYGPDWLSYAGGKVMGRDAAKDMLTYIPEDLESLADLLDTLSLSIRDKDDPAHMLCSILSIQARAHMEIADFVLSEMEREDSGEESQAASMMHAAQGDNIILFPAHLRH